MDLFEAIYTRRSIRKFTSEPVAREQLMEIIKAGCWAPSGMNNQPWRFAIVQSEPMRRQLAKHTKYRVVIERAPVCIAVFVDKRAMYHEVKDHQSIGACIQNMLLAAHGLGLGAVWLGEILKEAEQVRELLGQTTDLELMAVVAIGHPVSLSHSSTRKDPSEMLLAEF